jgi:hypothetical protein
MMSSGSIPAVVTTVHAVLDAGIHAGVVSLSRSRFGNALCGEGDDGLVYNGCGLRLNSARHRAERGI